MGRFYKCELHPPKPRLYRAYLNLVEKEKEYVYEKKEQEYHKQVLEMENIHKIKGLCMKGVLISKGEIKTGTSARGEWKMMDFVVEEYGGSDNPYPQTVKFSASGSVVDKVNAIPEKTDVTVLFDIRGREYNEKYYDELRAWAVKTAEEEQTAAGPAPTAPSAPTAEPKEDLPW